MSNYQLRATFNQAARDYDAVRPGYPDALIADVVEHSGLPSDGRILEVGCGAGQATLPFAQRGYPLLCLDIGADLVAIAQEKLRSYPGVRFQVVSFEDWPLEEQAFDLLISATAWHWIPPEIGYAKAARALKPGGALAIFGNHHPPPFTGFFAANQPIYDRIVPEWSQPDDRPTPETQAQTTAGWLEQTGAFEPPIVRRYTWSKDYTRAEYLRLLNTYSEHLGMEPSRRSRLHAALGELIDRDFGGVVTRPYLSVLHLARKRGGT